MDARAGPPPALAGRLMRIRDLLSPYEDGLVRVLDETPPGFDVRRQLLLPDTIEYVTAAPGASTPIPADTLVLTLMGPDRAVHGDPGAAGSVVARLRQGGRALILFAWRPDELPYERILDDLVAHSCQVVQVARLDPGAIGSGPIGAAAVVERVDALQLPSGTDGEPGSATSDGPDQLAIGLRIVDAYAFVAFSERLLREGRADGSGSLYQGGFDAYRSRLEGQLRERDARIGVLETEIARYERSGALRLGRVLVEAGRSPRALARLPLDLVRIWRSKGP